MADPVLAVLLACLAAFALQRRQLAFPCLMRFRREAGNMIREIHDGPGVLPGRYAGPAIAVHAGLTPQQAALAEEPTRTRWPGGSAQRPRSAGGPM